MNSSTTEFRNRLKTAQDRFERLRLREDITAFIDSAQFQELSQSDKNRIEDLLVEAIAKEEQFKECDPLRTILNY